MTDPESTTGAEPAATGSADAVRMLSPSESAPAQDAKQKSDAAQALTMRIPTEYGASVSTDYDGLVVSIPLGREPDYRELGTAFVRLGVGLWAKAAGRD